MLVRIWDMELGEDQEPPSAPEAMDEVTTVAVAVRRDRPTRLPFHLATLAGKLLAIWEQRRRCEEI